LISFWTATLAGVVVLLFGLLWFYSFIACTDRQPIGAVGLLAGHALCGLLGSISLLNSSPAVAALSVGPRGGVVVAFVAAAGDVGVVPLSMNRAMASIEVYRPPPICIVSSGLFFFVTQRHTVAGLSRLPGQRLGTCLMTSRTGITRSLSMSIMAIPFDAERFKRLHKESQHRYQTENLNPTIVRQTLDYPGMSFHSGRPNPVPRLPGP